MDSGMLFERTLMLFVGDKAYQTAGQESNPRSRRDWLVKITKQIIKQIDYLETTIRHKQILMHELELILNHLKTSREASWELVYRLIRLAGLLLGRGYVTPAYFQTEDQYYTEMVQSGRDSVQHRQDAISLRREVVEWLKAKGCDDFNVAVVLNTSEYEVKKLRRVRVSPSRGGGGPYNRQR